MTATKSKLDKIPPELQTVLLDGLDHALKEGNWHNYLNMMTLFPSYSLNNSILIYMQQLHRKRDPSGQVAAYTAWPKFKRHVKSGAKSYAIIKPLKGRATDKKTGEVKTFIKGFIKGSTFDYRDTDGEPLVEPPKRNPMQQLDGEVSEDLFKGLAKVAEARRIIVRRNVSKDDLEGAHGRCYFNGMGAYKIEIADIKPASAASTFAHELAHSILHSKDDYEGHLETSIKELEAESTAFLVMKHYGIDTGEKAFDYILDWQKRTLKPDQVREAMLGAGDRIAKAYKEITQIVDAYLEEVKS